ncbi:hypothetical protein FO440_23090 [Mucilaginibacter corticis]|uniref:Uncharacterized protein n=1 Tax=Mucilaginibacter corticis TaxID=2597670 RepID=A0A556M904_9SPHI|nr:hypothetical protein [Mucilaginibacter corticis]TSJ36389.1 hypothetical protein FO440_23090 [Mucilaginibacter corticis]
MKKFVIFLLLSVSGLIAKGQASKFEVVSRGKDSKGRINRLSVYVSKMSLIKKINPVLWGKYKSTKIKTFQIFYYDDKKIAKAYHQLLYNKKITKKQMNSISKHVVGEFEFVLGKENLFVGKNALLN